MATSYNVGLTPAFRTTVGQWSDDDQDILLGLIAALADFGFDVICGGRTMTVEGLSVEFVEPGETPDMVWARVFLDLTSRCAPLRLHQRDDRIVIEAG